MGDEPDGADTGGISNIEDVFSFTGEVQVVFNTTLEQQTFAVPESFLAVLPADYPTEIRIFESAPNLEGNAEATPSDTGGAYIKALVQGQITLFNSITLTGFLAFTRQVGEISFIKVDGAVSANVAHLGSLSGTLSLGFFTDIDPVEDESQPAAVGRVTLSLQAGGLIPGVELTGQVLVQFNTYTEPVDLDTIKVKGDIDGYGYDQKDSFQVALGANNLVQTGVVSIDDGFLFIITGTLVVGPLEVRGKFILAGERRGPRDQRRRVREGGPAR